MTTQVHQRDYFSAVLYNLLPILIFILVESLRDDLLAIGIEAHDLLTNGACPAGFLLVPVVKDPGSGDAIAIVWHALGQDSHQSGLTGIDVTYDAKLDVLDGCDLLVHNI